MTTTQLSDRPSLTASPSPMSVAAVVAAACHLAAAPLALTGADLTDHTTGPGAVSEVLAGLAFLAGGLALALGACGGWRAWLWWLAPSGMVAAGLIMVAVPLVGAEPPLWLALAAVVPAFVGQVAAGVLGTGRLWPWWTGLGVALLLPIMFLMPWNTVLMAAVWLLVARSVRRH